jgi:hypothetical protein
MQTTSAARGTTVRASSVVLVLLLALTGCAGTAAQYASGSTSGGSEVPVVRTELTADEKAACAEPGMQKRLEEALSSQTEGAHNGLLATPEEVAELDGDAADRQKRAWDALSDDELLWQLCLRDHQGGGGG